MTPAGRVAVAGGYDPDVFADWQGAGAPVVEARARVVAVAVPPGPWIVDVYTHADSMNGEHLISQLARPHGGAGGWFRASHPRRAFPLWLAHGLWFGGEGDPGRERLWARAAESIRAGALDVEVAPTGFVGYLVHLQRPGDGVGLTAVPEDGWFDIDAGSRPLTQCPVGLPSAVANQAREELIAPGT